MHSTDVMKCLRRSNLSTVSSMSGTEIRGTYINEVRRQTHIAKSQAVRKALLTNLG